MNLTNLKDARSIAKDLNLRIATIGDTPFFLNGLEDLLEIEFLSLLRKEDASESFDSSLFIGDLREGRRSSDRLSIDESLSLSEVQSVLRSETLSGLFVWDHSEETESLCQRAGIRLFTPPRELVRRLENKILLPKYLEAMKLPSVPSITVKSSDLPDWRQIVKELGSKVVIQYPENNTNGKSTFIISNEGEYDLFKEMHNNDVFLKISKYLDGGSVVAGGCVLRQGLVHGALFSQLVGIQELISLPGGYCGNEFPVSRLYGEEIGQNMGRAMEAFAEFLQGEGFLGVFGLDFVIDEKGIPYIIDLNPRLQSSQSLTTSLQYKANLPPIAFLHILEFLNVPFKIDREAYRRLVFANGPQVSQMIIFHQGTERTIESAPLPGRLSGTGERLGNSLSLNHLAGLGEYILLRACEKGRRLLAHSTMYSLQSWTSCLETKFSLKPEKRTLIQKLREKVLYSEEE